MSAGSSALVRAAHSQGTLHVIQLLEPARLAGLAAPALTSGAVADLCLFDPERWWKVEPGALRSQGKNTPFLGLELKGRVQCTLVAGQVVFEA